MLVAVIEALSVVLRVDVVVVDVFLFLVSVNLLIPFLKQLLLGADDGDDDTTNVKIAFFDDITNMIINRRCFLQ